MRVMATELEHQQRWKFESRVQAVLTDLVCSGRGAITGGGVASSSSSSSDTVATAGVSDTALEFCERKG